MEEKTEIKQLKLLTEYSDDLLWILDRNMNVEYMSPSVELHSGFSVDESLNLPLYTFYTPESVDTIMRSFTEELLRGKDIGGQTTTRRLELEANNKDGSTDWVEVQATIIRDEEGNIDKIVGSTRKITERKQMEEHRVNYLRALVHELKSPLTAITASCKLLIDTTKEYMSQRLAENIYRGAMHINDRSDELLDLAKGELRMLELNKKDVNTTQYLTEIADEMKQAFALNKLKYSYQIPDSLPEVSIDKARIRQVLQNIFNNALKWTKEKDTVELRAKYDKRTKSIVVEIQDTGVGIEDERQASIFQPYVHTSVVGRPTKGLGIGLALAKTLIELHGGRIWVKSKFGEGSTFGISIPV